MTHLKTISYIQSAQEHLAPVWSQTRRALKAITHWLSHRAVHESWLLSLDSSPESHVPSLESLPFPGAESRVIILESESSRVIAKVSRVIIAQLVVST